MFDASVCGVLVDGMYICMFRYALWGRMIAMVHQPDWYSPAEVQDVRMAMMKAWARGQVPLNAACGFFDLTNK